MPLWARNPTTLNQYQLTAFAAAYTSATIITITDKNHIKHQVYILKYSTQNDNHFYFPKQFWVFSNICVIKYERII